MWIIDKDMIECGEDDGASSNDYSRVNEIEAWMKGKMI